MAAVRHLGFLKLKVLTASEIGCVLHHPAKFYGDRLYRCRDISRFSNKT